MTPGTLNLQPGGSAQLTAVTLSAAGTELTGRTITWSTAGPSVATVSASGLVTGVGDGTTTVSASAEGRSGVATVIVRTPVASVTVTPPNASLTLGGPSVQFQATTRSASGATLLNREVTWSSSNPTVVAVSATGSATAVAPGSASVIATSEGSTGSATVTVAPPNPCAVTRPITIGQTLSGTLSATDCRLSDQTVLQTFRLSVNSVTTLEIQMTSTAVDPYLFVTDGEGNVLAEDDDGGSGINARVLGTFRAGEYFILANTFDPNSYGTFQLSVAPAPLPCVTARATSLPASVPSALGPTTSCRLNDDRYYDLYSVSVGSTSIVRFDMTSTAVDPFLVVFDPTGNAVAQDDDGGAGTNSRIEVQLTAGQYFVFATARPNQTGAYRLDATAIIDPCAVTRTINPGQTQNSTLTAADCSVMPFGPVPFTQRWLLNVTTAQALQVDMTSSAVDAYLLIQDAVSGAVLAENDDASPTTTNARIAAFFPAGQYIINTMTYFFGQVGPYSLSVAPISSSASVTVAPNAVALTSGQTQQLTANVSGISNTAVTWETSSSAVAVVSTTGLVRAITPGTATITARSVADPSKSGTASVTVSQSATGNPNLDIAAMYLVQAVQTLNNTVRLVANRDAIARIFVRGSRTGITGVTVRVRVLEGATILATLQSTVTPSLTVDESCCAANILIPAAHIRTGVSFIADVDPGNTIAESNETDNAFPLNGTPQPLNVTTVPDMNIRLVPVRQNRSGLTGTATTSISNKVRSLWPLGTVNITNRAPLTIDYTLLGGQSFNEWVQLVADLELVRRAEIANTYYFGLVRVSYESGITGLAGGIPSMAAAGVDESFGVEYSHFNFAHELGHTMGLRHAPCGGAAGPDPGYPFANGRTGAFGIDIAAGGVIKSSTFADVMTYCEPQWVSAYNYNIVMDRRAQFPNGVPATMISPVVAPVLLVSGRVSSGQAVLDGSFAMNANPSVADPAGRFILEGFDASGRTVFTHRFSPFPVSDARPDDEAFVLGIPMDAGTVTSLARIEVRELGGAARRHVRTRATGDAASEGLRSAVSASRLAGGMRLSWSTATTRMVLVRNPQNGQVLGVSRLGALDLTDFGNLREVELLVSDGISSIRQRVNLATGAIIR